MFYLHHITSHNHTGLSFKRKRIFSYRIAGNFWGGKLSWLGEKYNYALKTFVDCSLLLHQRTSCAPNFTEKTSQIVTKLQNLWKFSLLKVSRYDIYIYNIGVKPGTFQSQLYLCEFKAYHFAAQNDWNCQQNTIKLFHRLCHVHLNCVWILHSYNSNRLVPQISSYTQSHS